MALSFAIGSTCFLVGPFPGYAELVGGRADAVTFFVGSIFFTLGGALQSWLAFADRGEPGAGAAAWWSAIIQSAGTLFFNVSTCLAMDTAISNPDYDRLVWRPDAFGSVCFLVSRAIAYRAAPRRGWLPRAGAGWWSRHQPARLHLLRHLGDRRVRRPVQRERPRPRGGQPEHEPRRGLLPGLRGRHAAGPARAFGRIG